MKMSDQSCWSPWKRYVVMLLKRIIRLFHELGEGSRITGADSSFADSHTRESKKLKKLKWDSFNAEYFTVSRETQMMGDKAKTAEQTWGFCNYRYSGIQPGLTPCKTSVKHKHEATHLRPVFLHCHCPMWVHSAHFQQQQQITRHFKRQDKTWYEKQSKH